MKQSNEHGFFYLLKRTNERLSSVFRNGVLAILLVFGLQAVKAENLSNNLEIVELQTTVSGTVTDADGAPLPGANVLVKGTTNGTQTDFDGNYSITADANATLVFSYIGFASQEVAVGGQTTINVSLSEDANKLDEVVIVGYVAQTRADLTGSVASVDVSEAAKQPVVNVAEALEGRVTGVSVTNSGSPGSAPTIRIRGLGSPNNNNPLYIIDGVQTDDPNVLTSINPQDIAQFNVLKDGTAAIYGARAANGVVIITTKNGSYNQDKLSVNVDVSTGFNRAVRLPKVLGAQELGEVFFQSLTNDAIRTGTPVADISHPQYFPNGGSPVVPSSLIGARVDAPVTGPNGTNWLDEIYRSAPTQNITASFSNGSEKARFLASFGYLNREGIQLATGFKRGQVRLNSEFKLGKRLTIGQHLNASNSNNQNVNGNRTEVALRISPLVPVRDANGDFAGTYANPLGLSNATNPVADLIRDGDDFLRQTRIIGDVYANLELFDGLAIKTTIGGELNAFSSRDFLALNPEAAEPRGTNTLTERNQSTSNWVWTNTLNYNKTFGKSTLSALVGLEAIRQRTKSLEVFASGFLFEDPDFYLLSNALGAPSVNPDNTFDGVNTLSSVFGSLNYSYDGKYLFTATLRRDRSSRFLGDNQSDTFPSVSGGWVISNEDWFNTEGALNRLKLKGSWGQLGNQSLPINNPAIDVFSQNINLADAIFEGNTVNTGAILGSLGNPDITWEFSEVTNFGIELGWFNNALSTSFEYFKSVNNSLLVQDTSVITDTALDAGPPFVNTGNITNEGFDIAIGYRTPYNDKDFSFGADLNVSIFNNETSGFPADLIGAEFRGGPITLTRNGEALSSFFGFQNDGIYRSEAEVIDGPSQGFDDNPAAGVGRLRYVDIDNNGIINDSDRTIIGNPHPDFTFGLNLTANFKNWDFSAFFTGTVGNDIYNYDRIFTDFPTFANGNRSTRVLDAFDPNTNPNGSAPALSFSLLNSETNPNSFLVEDGSFVRLRNLVVGYTLPSNVTDRWGITALRLYVNASNLFTITGYSGIDPDIPPFSGANSALTIGVDSNTYPLSQIVNLGVNLKL